MPHIGLYMGMKHPRFCQVGRKLNQKKIKIGVKQKRNNGTFVNIVYIRKLQYQYNWYSFR